jgi:3-oxoacyl-[acyl-carrier-protein] synthase-1
MSGVGLAGRGLACTLGADLPACVASLRAGGVAAGAFALAPGLSTPYFAIAGAATDWLTRARHLVRSVAAQSGAEAARDGPLFVASTSFDMGLRELGDEFRYDLQHFSETVAGWLDWRGPVFTVCTACTSALNAVLSATALLRAGDAEQALVLGLELASRYTIGGFHGMQLLSPTAARPFGAARNGLVLGEAVAALRLARGAARWRIRGGANVVDSRDPAGAVVDAVAAMAERALAASGLPAGAIDLVKLQAAGSPGNDAVEAAGLHRVFAPLPPLVSFKGVIGHTLGAAGAAELALLTACLEDGAAGAAGEDGEDGAAGAWPSIHYAQDPSLHATLAPRPPRPPRHVLAAILGFGGGHTAVVLEDTAAS